MTAHNPRRRTSPEFRQFKRRLRIILWDFAAVVLVILLYWVLTLGIKALLSDHPPTRRELLEGAHFWYTFALAAVFMVNSVWKIIFPESLWRTIFRKLLAQDKRPKPDDKSRKLDGLKTDDDPSEPPT